MSEVVDFKDKWRHNQRGYYRLIDLPQGGSIEDVSFGTGWWELDQILRFYPGQFVVVTGSAGQGKSTFLLNVMLNISLQDGIKTFLYAPENERYLIEKLRLMWRSDSEGFERFASEHCFVQSAAPLDRDPHTINWVLDKAATAVVQDGAEFVIIDPWNELERAKPKDMLLTDYICQCLMDIKDFCRTLNVTVVMVAHPTKAVNEGGGRTPHLSDIEGSMNWFNKCDNGLVVVRAKEGNSTKVISQKVREAPGAGKVGVCHFTVDGKTGIFSAQQGAVSV